jgi:hypothetical protein
MGVRSDNVVKKFLPTCLIIKLIIAGNVTEY